MESLIKNHLIYSNIYSNIDEANLYKLWCQTEFKESVTDYLLHNNNVNWKNFPLEIDESFISLLGDRIKCKCTFCYEYHNRNTGRCITYFEVPENMLNVFICSKCDLEYTVEECVKCFGQPIDGYYECCEDDCGMKLICDCINPNDSNVCEHCVEIGTSDHFYCDLHLTWNANENCDCEVVCGNCEIELSSN